MAGCSRKPASAAGLARQPMMSNSDTQTSREEPMRFMRSLRQKADRREPRHGVDLQQVRLEVPVEHDVHPRQVPAADHAIGLARQLAAAVVYVLRQPQIETVLGPAFALVLRVVIEERALDD